MARASANKLYRTFVKGLVTEASPLTYPEDTSYDELNTILSRKGSRTRRQGINYSASALVPSLEVTEDAISQTEYVWSAVARQSNLTFLVVQKGFNISFFDLSSEVSPTTLKSFSVDLSEYVISSFSETEAKEQVVQMSSGKGFLFIVSRATDPIVVEYKEDEDDITVTKLAILIRDFDGLNDGLANDEEPPELSKEHHYNLMNQGWLYGTTSASDTSSETNTDYTVSPQQYYYNYYTGGDPLPVYSIASGTNSPISEFFDEVGRYPGNNKQWWAARAEADDPDTGVEAGDFLPKVLDKLYSGNNRAPSGHFIVNAFTKERSALSGISDIDTEDKDFRPEAVTFFSGRAWYGAGSEVYYSQIIDSTGVYKAALCYQEADPTAEDISDLIASDGGLIPIPEADRIRKIVPLGNGVIVIAQNGVRFIGGGDNAFSATNISVSKVSSIGTKSPLASVVVEETLFWWNETGIQALQQASGQFGPIAGKFGNTNISEQTIQTLFNDIDEDNKKYVKAAFDPRNNRVIWLYNKDLDSFSYSYDRCLIYDLTLQAFFLWEFESFEDSTPVVTGIYNNVGISYATTENTIVDFLGNNVVSVADESVVSLSVSSLYSPTNIEFVVNVPDEGLSVATVNNSNYVDWESFDDIGLEYDSFIETGYELMDDAMRNKQLNYVFCHFTRVDNSTCKMTTKWEWSNSSTSNRWSREVEAYRIPNNTSGDGDAFAAVTSKHKVRGHGKAIQFRFGTSERGKNFELLGWSVAISGNTQP